QGVASCARPRRGDQRPFGDRVAGQGHEPVQRGELGEGEHGAREREEDVAQERQDHQRPARRSYGRFGGEQQPRQQPVQREHGGTGEHDQGRDQPRGGGSLSAGEETDQVDQGDRDDGDDERHGGLDQHVVAIGHRRQPELASPSLHAFHGGTASHPGGGGHGAVGGHRDHYVHRDVAVTDGLIGV